MLFQQLRPGLGGSIQHRCSPRVASLSTRACSNPVVRASAAHQQSRNFWGCRRGVDYVSHLDPSFHRFTRYRTLKTRAKLLDKLRRRDRWEWDGPKPFFTSRHIRLASHWNGHRLPRWARYNENDDANSHESDKKAEEDGYELSRREKEWKEQMERMRKRIEKDPYEAVFGKRFEPFWSPLVPSWMREEMGLQGWPKVRDAAKVKAAPTATADKVESQLSGKYASLSAKPAEPSPSTKQAEKGVENDGDDGAPNGQLTNYSYNTSASWDSWTRTARREEWDSITGQTRRFEYDPISNRMVQVKIPSTASSLQPYKPSVTTPKTTAPDPPSSTVPAHASAVNIETSPSAGAVDVPVKTYSSSRKPISVPVTTTNTEPKTSVYFPSLLNTTTAPLLSRTRLTLSSSENDLDSLTADDVRASVGRPKHAQSEAGSVQKTLDATRAQRHGKVDPSRSEWERAESRFILEKEMDALSEKKVDLLWSRPSESRNSALEKIYARVREVRKQIEDLDAIKPSVKEQHSQALPVLTRSSSNVLNTAASTEQPAAQISTPQQLQPSIERMQSKTISEVEEPDDSAAHESTGDRVVKQNSSVPKGWATQADTLQADRIRRTQGNAPTQKLHVPRWLDDMNARKAEFKAKAAEQDASSAARDAKLQKARAMLEAEVEEQKQRMHSHEINHSIVSANATATQQARMPETWTAQPSKSPAQLQKPQDDFYMSPSISKPISAEERYVNKIRDLRAELDTAFKQSSANAEMQVERIRSLEHELTEARKAKQSASAAVTTNERERFVQKIHALRAELDTAFKQSSISAEMHMERIHALEKELDDLRKVQHKQPGSGKAVETVRGEGDFCSNITKYAKDSSRWYKRTASTPIAQFGQSTAEQKKSEQMLADRALVQEVKGIYERQYGTIDHDHVQPRHDSNRAGLRDARFANSTMLKLDSEPDTDLSRALRTFETDKTYCFQNQDLGNEIALNGRRAYDAQAPMTSENSSKSTHVVTEAFPIKDRDGSSQRDDGKSSKLATNKIGAPPATQTDFNGAATSPTTQTTVRWEEPPVYKVLAYDSGNDLLSISTTSSNFSGKENPISIHQALSQLYQPARFASRFSELQKEGYQAVYGAKDLLVLKKVECTSRLVDNGTNESIGLQDHGLLWPRETNKSGEARSFTSPFPGINPVDGTSLPPHGEPSTGSFASPTGFVGDRWETIESEQGKEKTSPDASGTAAFEAQKQQQTATDAAADSALYHPRVKREERVFTGSRLGQRSREQERRRKRHHHEPTHGQVREMRTKWKSYRRRMRWAVGVGIGAAAVAYGVGAAAERQERRDLERWEQILEGKRTRWD